MKKKRMAAKPKTGRSATQSSAAAISSTANPSKWIRIDRPFPLPAYVKEALARLDDAGHLAYVVGGSVRDCILGSVPKDHDVATSAEPDEICRLFPEGLTVGKAFGVIKVPVQSGEMLEIATFRKDLQYNDHRHPEGILFAGPAEDASRRDFTVNALFYDPKTQRVLDAVGGLEDLKSKLLRAIGSPSERFREDALRLLRLVRFMGQLGFRIDDETERAAISRAKLIGRVSPERSREELEHMLCGPSPGVCIRKLSDYGLLAVILPEVEGLKDVQQPSVLNPEGMEKNIFLQTIRVLDCLRRTEKVISPELGWAALLSGTGKAAAAKRSGGKNFNGFEKDSAEIAQKVCHRFKLSGRQTDAVVSAIGGQLKFKEVFQMREATLQRFLAEPWFEDRLALHRADALASDGNLAFYEFCRTRREELAKTPLLDMAKIVTGEDLIQLGFKPGPLFTRILRAVEDQILERKIQTKDQALEFVVKNFVS